MNACWFITHGRLLCEFFYAWQTLITGLLALLAAYLAGRPVWRQLTSLQIQSALMERETLTTRVAAIESRRDITLGKDRSYYPRPYQRDVYQR